MSTKDTKLGMPNGDEVQVSTDENGTRVYRNDRPGYTSGGDRHEEQVKDYERQGGRIVDGWGFVGGGGRLSNMKDNQDVRRGLGDLP